MQIVVGTSRLAVLCVVAMSAALSTKSVQTQSKPAEWRLTQTAAVGDGSNTVILEDVLSVQLLKNGRVAIADAKAKSVVVADSMGRALPALGRTGAGPAEYRSPQALATIGDTIAVLDPGNARIGLFNTKGEWQGEWRSQPITGDAGVRLFRVSSGEFYNYGYRVEGKKALTIFIRFDKGGPQDTIVPSDLPPPPGVITCHTEDRRIWSFSSVFQKKHLRIPGPGSSILDAETDSYRIVQSSAGSTATTTFVGSGIRAPLGNAEWDSTTAGFRNFVQKYSAAGCTQSSMPKPPTKPAVRAFWWDDTGRLWVERYVANGFAFDVFAKNGTQIATMPAPNRVADVEPSVVGSRLALLTVGNDGIPIVRVYRFGAGN
ncbi:MAG: hypothetical protein ABJB74_01810 [Gemmatimonas sp.]